MANKFLIVCGGSGVGLLGQRRVLAITAELQVDVSKEMLPTRGDSSSLRVMLDKPIGTVPLLLLDMKSRIDGSSKCAAASHTGFVYDHWLAGGDLSDGLAQAPVIGGGAIRHEANVTELRGRFNTMINTLAQNIGEENPIEVWIVSSTAGGTGAGIHRFVGAMLAEAVGEQYWAYLKLNFVRIGPLTYRSVNARATGLNTFFGVAADAAFALRCGRLFPGAIANWYYLELPDVGSGDGAKPVRAELVAMAVKSLMLDELDKPLNTLLVNDGLRMVLVRVGYWGRDFADKVKYYETLRQLIEKLKDLTEPDHFTKYLQGKPRPTFQPGASLPKVLEHQRSEQNISHKMQGENWRFPRYSGRSSEEDRIKEWTRAIDRFIAPVDVESLALETGFETEGSETAGQETEDHKVVLGVPEFTGSYAQDSWFEAVINAQRVKAWCSSLLATTARGEYVEGLRDRLVRLGKACSDAQHGFNPMKGTAARISDLGENLADFTETLVQVVRLKELEKAADRFLETQLAGPRELLEEATRQLDIARSAIEGVGTSPVIGAELSDRLDRVRGMSWLGLLDRAFHQDGAEGFKQEVLKGAIGLTHAGLLNVLGLPGNADRQKIQEALKETMGRIPGADGDEFEAQWWQAKKPAGVKHKYLFRIMPRLERASRNLLGEEDGEIRYLYTDLGVIGLYVLAFEGVSLGTGSDTVTTPAYLLRPFIPLVRDALKNWPKKPPVGLSHGQIEIAKAGAVGEPLYEMALCQAGLSDEEVGTKIGQFFELYDPNA